MEGKRASVSSTKSQTVGCEIDCAKLTQLLGQSYYIECHLEQNGLQKRDYGNVTYLLCFQFVNCQLYCRKEIGCICLLCRWSGSNGTVLTDVNAKS